MDFPLYAALREIKPDDAEVASRVKCILQNFEKSLRKKLEPKLKIDLIGYPKYPWICEGFPYDYKCRGLTRNEIFEKYHWIAVNLGAPVFDSPDHPSQREATKIWINDRINFEFKDAMDCAKSEQEVSVKMSACMEAIHDDLKLMIAGEDRYWRGPENNPLRISEKK